MHFLNQVTGEILFWVALALIYVTAWTGWLWHERRMLRKDDDDKD